MENKNEPNPDWVSAPMEITTITWGSFRPKNMSRKRWRHVCRQKYRQSAKKWHDDIEGLRSAFSKDVEDVNQYWWR